MSREFFRRTLLQGCRDQLAAQQRKAAVGRPGCIEARRKATHYSAAILLLEMAAPEQARAA